MVCRVTSMAALADTSPFLCLSRYGMQLKNARNVGIKKSFFSSLAIGSLYLIIFCTFALGFW